MVAAFGSDQSVPYNPAEFLEFRFKGRLCTGTFSAETWLSQVTPDIRFSNFGLKFLLTRKFAVWVPRVFADEFWENVQEFLPKGLKLYRRPVQLSDIRSNFASDGISTPSALTP